MKPAIRRDGSWLIGAVLSALIIFGAIVFSTKVETPVAHAGVYNRTAAVNYAHAYWQARNSNYNNYPNNCTNYVSQVLEAGGMPMIHGNHNENSIYQWYHYSDWFGKHHSKSWSATEWLNQHLHQYQGSRYEIRSNATGLSPGDFFLMQLPGNTVPSHARVIVGYGNSAQGQNTPIGTYGQLADSNSTDRYKIIWNDPVPAGTPYWFVHVLY